MIEWLWFAGAAIVTVIVGAPRAAALAGRHRWVHAAPRDPSSRKQRTDVVRAYKPLDLGVDPIRWPSERLWALESTLVAPDWPSRSWNDEHFGRHWKDVTNPDASEAGFHAMAARRHREVADATARHVAERAHAAERARQPATEKIRASGAEKPRAAGVRRGRDSQDAKATPVPATAKPVKPSGARVPVPTPPPLGTPKTRAPATAPPDAAELEHLIATVGLAGTVQAIMQRTGWEFREAAQYLARIRQGQGRDQG